MRFLHLSDLHLGKRINEISLLEDQRYILGQITEYIRKNRLDAVVIAGDIYDKSVPSSEAMSIYSGFVEELSDMKVPVLIISGNHDSAERLSYFGDLMKKHGIYLGTDISSSLRPVTLTDEYGEVDFYLLPFLRPSDVNNALETECGTYTEAVAEVIKRMRPDESKRNVMVSHQYVAGASVCDSEILVGGIECIDVSVYEAFDYTALGHLHTPQNVGSDRIRYCGTPLKYSLSEAVSSKSMTVVTLGAKGDVSVETVPLIPLRDMRRIRGSFDELMKGVPTDDYIYAELTDENDVPFAGTELRTVYKNFISATYTRFGSYGYFEGSADFAPSEEKTPQQIFTEFFRSQHGNKDMSDVQLEILRQAIEKAWG